MSRDNQHGTLRVQITSIDGNTTHVFRANQTIGDVREYAYQKLVQDKSQVTLDGTWVERGDGRVGNDALLGSLAGGGQGHGNEIDLTLTLAWVTQGG